MALYNLARHNLANQISCGSFDLNWLSLCNLFYSITIVIIKDFTTLEYIRNVVKFAN